MFNGDRIRQARELSGFTQADLAKQVGVHQSNIARLERNAFEATDELLGAIAIRTRFPLSFFRQDSGPDFPLGSLLYRKRSSLKSQQKAQVHQLARFAFELAERLASRFGTFQITLPRLVEDPVTAARIARSALGFSPDTPVAQLIHRLEKHGVFVIAIPGQIDEHDAFSLWADMDPRKPVIVLSAGKPGDRQRFTVAHELGHLVMHQSARGTVKKLEEEAHSFASEFLLPEESIRNELVTPLTLTTLAELKRRWGVSIQALIMRARDLQIINDRQRKYLFQQLSVRGWRKREPIQFAEEKPSLLRRMGEELYGRPIDYQRIATEHSSPLNLVREIFAANGALVGVPRDRPSSTQESVDKRKRALDFPMHSRLGT